MKASDIRQVVEEQEKMRRDRLGMERFGLEESVLVTHSQSGLVNVGGRTVRVVPAHEYLT